MSIWDEYSIESRIRQILDVTSHDKGHHFGRPFLTAYQIAIAFEKAHRIDAERIGKPVGGKGTGRKDSLARYLARQLSRRIKSGELPDIEGRFLHRQHLRSLEYNSEKGIVESSLGQASDLSMFRLTDKSRA